MKRAFCFAFILLSTLSFSQNFEDTWEDHFSYNSIKAISEGNNKIYAAAENSVFVYDISTQEIETISTVQGLSGEQISTIYYSENFGTLVIGYENGLIDIVMDNEEEVLSVVDILEKQTIPPDDKRINQFNEYNGNLYIAAEFGISLYNLSALEFGDTYFIGDQGAQIDIRQTAIKEPYIYAASFGGGLRRALVDNDNLIDFEEWSTIATANFRGAQTVGDEIYFVRFTNNIVRFVEGSGLLNVTNVNGTVVDFTEVDKTLTITTEEEVLAYDEDFNLLSLVPFPVPDFESVPQSGISLNNNFFIGTSEKGILQFPFSSSNPTQILPDGPLFNQAFAIDASPGQLWLSYGDVDVNFDPAPKTFKGLSNLVVEEGWTNINYETLFETFGKDANDIVDILINPNDPQEVYATSFSEGLLRVRDQTPEILFDETNSNNVLEDAFIGSNNAGLRLYGMDFDSEGNLWTVQSRKDDGLIRLSPSGQFQSIDVTPILENVSRILAFSEVKVSREGFIYFGTSDSGLVAYNPSSGAFNIINANEAGGNLPSPNVRALAFDANNRLWIGTLQGIRVFFNVGGIFEEDASIQAQEIIILENGIPQEFLFGISITDIEVDGSNNKWISTATSGVFYVTPNAQETLLRFTKDNSPLPTNNVQDITIDEETGTVYFATQNGLVAFKGTSTAPEEDLSLLRAFPNPVRPGFEGNVTIDGLTANANVKITDITGNLVFETTSEGGSVLWDTRAFGAYKVRSGVYLVLVTTEDAFETKVAKIMIVR